MDEPAVNYSIKELFDKLEQKVDRIFDVLSSKADHADVAALNVRLNEHDGRLAELERVNKFEKESKTAQSDYKRWFIPTVVGVAGLLIALIGVIVTYLVSS